MPRPLRELTPERSPAHRLGAAVQQRRVDQGLSREELGKAVNVSAWLIAKLETGSRISTSDVIGDCDDLLGAGGELVALWSLADAARRVQARSSVASGERRGLGCDGVAVSATPLERAVVHVEQCFGIRLRRAELVRGGGSALSGPTDRGTWMRIASCRVEEATARGWSGIDVSARMRGVAAPTWMGSLTWRDQDSVTLWRADELAKAEHPPVERGPVLRADPRLPESWWRAWNGSLDALAHQPCGHAALVGGKPVSEFQLARAIARVWPDAVDMGVGEWSVAHGAMTWAKLTGPRCQILGWSSWGLAPRGLDAAMLWSCSLAVPEVAARIWRERRMELESPSGQVAVLYCLARILTDPVRGAGPLNAAARHAAARLIAAGIPTAV